MDCNNGKCKKVRRGEEIHPLHNENEKMKELNETQQKLTKAKRTRDFRTFAVGITSLVYIVFAWYIWSNESFQLSEILMPFTLGIGIGMLLVLFSITLNYETNKKLIEIDARLNEINDKLSIRENENNT